MIGQPSLSLSLSLSLLLFTLSTTTPAHYHKAAAAEKSNKPTRIFIHISSLQLRKMKRNMRSWILVKTQMNTAEYRRFQTPQERYFMWWERVKLKYMSFKNQNTKEPNWASKEQNRQTNKNPRAKISARVLKVQGVIFYVGKPRKIQALDTTIH